MTDEYGPLANLLTGQFGWVATTLVWIGALRMPLKLLSNWLQATMTRMVTQASLSPELGDNEVLFRILSNRAYRVFAFLLDLFCSVKLPTRESLIKHLRQQETPSPLPP